MKKAIKRFAVAGLAGMMLLTSATTAFAGTWKQDSKGWWYQNDNGSYPSNGWQWITGADGLARSYYFNTEGYILTNTTTPDGYTVNADGAWTVNGVVQTQQASSQVSSQQAGIDLSWLYNADGTFNGDMMVADCEEMYTLGASADRLFDLTEEELPGMYTQMMNLWAQSSAKGAKWKSLFDRYGVPVYLGDHMTVVSDSLSKFEYYLALPEGITEAELDGAVAAVSFALAAGARYDGVNETLTYEWLKDGAGIVVIKFTGDVNRDLMMW